MGDRRQEQVSVWLEGFNF